jgi:hypothetical protein
MKKFILAATIVVAALAGPGAAAQAAAFTNAEIRLSIWNGEAEEAHLWRLRPGGRASGISSAHYNRGRGYWHEEITDTGSWTYSGNTLCVTWRRLLQGGQHCFRLTIKGSRLIAAGIGSGRTSRGTIHPLGK